MDWTKNQVKGINGFKGPNVWGYPTMIFYPKGKKPVEYSGSGERTVRAFVLFLKKHSSKNVDWYAYFN